MAHKKRTVGLAFLGLVVGSAVLAGLSTPIPMTPKDFYTPGTQPGDMNPYVLRHSSECRACHGDYDEANEPFSTWQGSLMGMAGRDPLFFAQLATANQDVANVGQYCIRCHAPMSIATGTATDPTGESLGYLDIDGVSCHMCHAMVDPIYKPGISPERDAGILAALDDVPEHYGNAMIVLDPDGVRRGPYPPEETLAPHQALRSDFIKTSEFCGSCHDVGNLAVTLQPDGTYRYNGVDEESPTSDPHGQFPLERTYTEWKLSAFADGPIDMGGRFGGYGVTSVSTCQDCHMPKTKAQGCFFGDEREDLARHDFAGASSWVLEIIAEHNKDGADLDVSQAALIDGQMKAKAMLRQAATLETAQASGVLNVRVINETGHKLPTGHIEGRRVWVNVRMYDAQEELIHEYGHYDYESAHLDEASTTIYEMHVGLSEDAAAIVGDRPGTTTRMALADTIVKDNRIPPRGFENAAFAAAGAPVVGAEYADGEHWSDVRYFIPDGAARVEVNLYYATVTRHYIEALRDNNHTNHWGDTLYDLWLRTDKAAPVLMATADLAVSEFLRGDIDKDGVVGTGDLGLLLNAWQTTDTGADLNADGVVDTADLGLLLGRFGSSR